jgi:asparaginyl-tRNA synthetase
MHFLCMASEESIFKTVEGVFGMNLIEIRELYKNQEAYLDKEITVGGWVRSIRDSKAFGFIVINDGTFFTPLQVVYHDDMENFEEISKLNVGAAVVVTGTLVATPQAKQPFEIQAKTVTVEGASAPDYPLQKKRHSFEYLRTIAHLRPRTNTFQAVFRVRSLTAYALHKFFQERGFVYVHTPIITGSDCEGAGEMFRVTTMDMENVPKTENGAVDYTQDFFGKETSLTVSGQLNAETYAQAFGNVYTFGPTFRAENSNTTRHAAEFWMLEPEMAFADLEDDMDLAEDMLKYVINYVMENAPEEMNFFNSFVDKGLIDRLTNVATSEFARITYTDAIEILKKHNDKFEFKVSWGIDLQTEHERYLTEEVYKRPVFVTDYPKDIKAFYMKQNPDGKTVAAVDCLVPGIGEIIGGSQREDDYEKLATRMEELGMKTEDYGFYMDLRKYGSTRHAGFGLGFERCIMYLTGMGNIRDVVPFPRTVNNCEL